jgi:hypothetical protein
MNWKILCLEVGDQYVGNPGNQYISAQDYSRVGTSGGSFSSVDCVDSLSSLVQSVAANEVSSIVLHGV